MFDWKCFLLKNSIWTCFVDDDWTMVIEMFKFKIHFEIRMFLPNCKIADRYRNSLKNKDKIIHK